MEKTNKASFPDRLTLKIAAAAAMLADHIGFRFASFIPEAAPVLRIIGRSAFPLFAFMVAEGAKKSRNIKKYMLRLLIFAILSEPIYDLFLTGKLPAPGKTNVLFTLLLGLLSVVFFRMITRFAEGKRGTAGVAVRLAALLPAVAAMAAAQLMSTDYGYWGVLLVFLFSLPDRTTPAGIALTAGICVIFASRNLLTYSAGLILSSFAGTVREPPGSWQLTQIYSAAALLLILPYRGSAGPRIPEEKPGLRKAVQLAFYAFYPLHMLALSLISMLIKK
ncbi:MAG: hypothetical protein J5592_09750 [Clostridia bacterium]|nr:hypothetical protein [Clostridia bacterium]